MVIHINIQGVSYTKISDVCTELPMCSNSVFPNGKYISPSYIFDKFFN